MRQRNEWGGKKPYNQTKTEKPVTLQDLLGYQFTRYDALRKHAIVLIDIDGNDYGPIGPYRKDEAEHIVQKYGTNRWCQETNRWVTNPDRIGAQPQPWVDYRIVEAPQAGFHDGIGWDPEWVEAKHAGWQMVADKLNSWGEFWGEAAINKWMRCDGKVYTVFWECVIEYLETQLASRAVAVWKLHPDYNADESELRSGIVRMVLANTRGRPMYRDMGVELREAKLALVECHKMLGQIRRRLDEARPKR